MPQLKFDVFGRRVHVTRDDGQWSAFYPGEDGKRRLATDIVIPSELAESQLEQYLADLCHEWASARYTGVIRID